MSVLEIERLCVGLAFGIPLVSVLVGGVVVLPICLGLRAAKRKGVSRAWMWLSLVFPPLGAWAAYLGIVVLVRRTACPRCGHSVPDGLDVCPACHTPMAVTRAAIEQRSRTRWALWTGKIFCPGCGRLVGPNTDECSRCGTPLPRVQCPVCGGHDTQVIYRPKLLRPAGLVLLVFSGALICAAQNMWQSNTALAGGLFVAAVYLALIALLVLPLLGHSHWGRLLFCRPCYYRHHKFYRLRPREVAWYEPEEDEDRSADREADTPQALPAAYGLLPPQHPLPFSMPRRYRPV
jgi:RNA polymerase subunit RPABC4/transcription elongation factor Spt4